MEKLENVLTKHCLILSELYMLDKSYIWLFMFNLNSCPRPLNALLWLNNFPICNEYHILYLILKTLCHTFKNLESDSNVGLNVRLILHDECRPTLMHDSKETNGFLHCLDTVAQMSNFGVVKCRQQEKSHKVIAMLGGRSYKGQHDEIPSTADFNDLVCHLVAWTHAREQCSCRSECLKLFSVHI